MPFPLESGIRYIADLGFFDIIIPFILVFVTVYGILNTTKVLGTERDGSPRNNLNAMVAFVMGFLVIASMQVIEAISHIARYSAVALVGVILLYTIGTMLDLKIRGKDLKESPWPKVLVALILGAIAIAALGAYDLIKFSYVAAITPALFLIAALGLIIYAVVHQGQPTQKPQTAAPENPETPKLRVRK